MFEGFGLDFLFGSALFGVLNILSLIVVLLVILIIWTLMIVATKEDQTTLRDFKAVIISGIIGLLLIGLLIPSTVIQPRVVIQTQPNSALIEHLENQSEIVIITPEPRTETLEGFRPLGQSN